MDTQEHLAPFSHGLWDCVKCLSVCEEADTYTYLYLAQVKGNPQIQNLN